MQLLLLGMAGVPVVDHIHIIKMYSWGGDQLSLAISNLNTVHSRQMIILNNKSLSKSFEIVYAGYLFHWDCIPRIVATLSVTLTVEVLDTSANQWFTLRVSKTSTLCQSRLLAAEYLLTNSCVIIEY